MLDLNVLKYAFFEKVITSFIQQICSILLVYIENSYQKNLFLKQHLQFNCCNHIHMRIENKIIDMLKRSYAPKK